MNVPGMRRSQPSAQKSLERESEEQRKREERRKEEELERGAPVTSATAEGRVALPVGPATIELAPATPGMILTPQLSREAASATNEAVRHASLKGLLLEQAGKPAEALAAYEEALAAASDSTFLLPRVARLRLDLDRPKEALEAAERAARLAPADAETQMIYARALYEVGDATRADLIFERAMELAPRNDAARLAMAQEYFNQRDWAPAARCFEEVLKHDPDKLPVRHALGVCRLRLGQYDAAVEQFKKVMEKYPNRETYMALAEALEGKGDISDAVNLYVHMAQTQRDDVESRRRLVRLLVEHGSPQDHRTAIDWYEDLLRIIPNDEESLRALTVLHFAFKHYAKSEEYLGELLRLHAESAQALATGRQIGTAYLRDVKDASAALRVFQKIKEATPGDPRADMGLGMAYQELGLPSQAIQAFSAVLAQNTDVLVAHVNLVELYRKERNFAAMLPHLEAAVRLVAEATGAPEQSKQLLFLHNYRGQTLLELGRFEEARLAAADARRLDPENEDATMLLAQTYLEEGQMEEMERVAREYLARHPQNAGMLNFLGYAFADKNVRLEEAEQLIRRALELTPDNGSIVDSLGWVLYRKGRYQEAIAELERAARLTPDSPEIVAHLGDAYIAAKNPEKARDQWQKALELDPANKEVKEKLANLKAVPPQAQNP